MHILRDNKLFSNKCCSTNVSVPVVTEHVVTVPDVNESVVTEPIKKKNNYLKPALLVGGGLLGLILKSSLFNPKKEDITNVFTAKWGTGSIDLPLDTSTGKINFESDISTLNGDLPNELFRLNIFSSEGEKLSEKVHKTMSGIYSLYVVKNNTDILEAGKIVDPLDMLISNVDKGIRYSYIGMRVGSQRLIICPINLLKNKGVITFDGIDSVQITSEPEITHIIMLLELTNLQ